MRVRPIDRMLYYVNFIEAYIYCCRNAVAFNLLILNAIFAAGKIVLEFVCAARFSQTLSSRILGQS
jgi:hypothetical protein